MMAGIPEPARLVAHVMADAVSALEPGSGRNSEAMDLALARLKEIDEAIVAHVDEDTGHLESLDISNLLGGALASINWLVTQLAEARGVDELDVIASLREALDSDSSGAPRFP
jgi:hypothetical protein